MKKKTTALVSLGAGAALALFAAPIAANAHVTATASTTAAGGYTIVTISVPHGCEDAATEVVTIDIPEPILSVTPTVNPNWDVEKVMTPLEETQEGAHGDAVTERVGQVVYTAKDEPLAADLRDTFELSLQLPQGEEGDVLLFPTTQGCVDGTTAAWDQEDQSADRPAPAITLTAATGDAHGAAAHDSDEADIATASETASANAGPDVLARVLGIGGLVVGAVGVAFGITARRRPASR
jgi:uncharacterized protein YcnI